MRSRGLTLRRCLSKTTQGRYNARPSAQNTPNATLSMPWSPLPSNTTEDLIHSPQHPIAILTILLQSVIPYQSQCNRSTFGPENIELDYKGQPPGPSVDRLHQNSITMTDWTNASTKPRRPRRTGGSRVATAIYPIALNTQIMHPHIPNSNVHSLSVNPFIPSIHWDNTAFPTIPTIPLQSPILLQSHCNYSTFGPENIELEYVVWLQIVKQRRKLPPSMWRETDDQSRVSGPLKGGTSHDPKFTSHNSPTTRSRSQPIDYIPHHSRALHHSISKTIPNHNSLAQRRSKPRPLRHTWSTIITILLPQSWRSNHIL